MLLPLVEALYLRAETVDFAGKVREHHVFRWDAHAVHIHVRRFAGHAIGYRPHDGQVLRIVNQPSRRVNDVGGTELLQDHSGTPATTAALSSSVMSGHSSVARAAKASRVTALPLVTRRVFQIRRVLTADCVASSQSPPSHIPFGQIVQPVVTPALDRTWLDGWRRRTARPLRPRKSSSNPSNLSTIRPASHPTHASSYGGAQPPP